MQGSRHSVRGCEKLGSELRAPAARTIEVASCCYALQLRNDDEHCTGDGCQSNILGSPARLPPANLKISCVRLSFLYRRRRTISACVHVRFKFSHSALPPSSQQCSMLTIAWSGHVCEAQSSVICTHGPSDGKVDFPTSHIKLRAYISSAW